MGVCGMCATQGLMGLMDGQTEFKFADENKDDQIDFGEFVGWYNRAQDYKARQSKMQVCCCADSCWPCVDARG